MFSYRDSNYILNILLSSTNHSVLHSFTNMALGCWFVFLSIVCGKQNDSHQVLIVTVSLKYGWVHELGLRYLVLACPLVEKKKIEKIGKF